MLMWKIWVSDASGLSQLRQIAFDGLLQSVILFLFWGEGVKVRD